MTAQPLIDPDWIAAYQLAYEAGENSPLGQALLWKRFMGILGWSQLDFMHAAKPFGNLDNGYLVPFREAIALAAKKSPE